MGGLTQLRSLPASGQQPPNTVTVSALAPFLPGRVVLNEGSPPGETGSGMLGFVDPQGPSWGFGSSAGCGRVTDP